MVRRRTAGLLVSLAVVTGALPVGVAAEELVEPVPLGVRCVGDPPRQTADPLSPPCIPFWEGDNHCQTYGIGVDCDEVRIVVYLEGGVNYINGSGAPGSDSTSPLRTPSTTSG